MRIDSTLPIEMTTELDVKLTALALIGRLQEEPESEILHFFKKSVCCVRDQAMRAMDNSKLLEPKLHSWGRVFTVAAILDFVKAFLVERERQRIIEEQEWANVSPSSEPEEPSRSTSWRHSRRIDAIEDDDGDVDMGILASKLQRGEFLVKCTKSLQSRDHVKEHDLEAGEVLVISQVRSLGDGSNDAWFCGYKVLDPSKVKKWVFSEHTTKLFH